MDDRIYVMWVVRNDPYCNQSWLALPEAKQKEIYAEILASYARYNSKLELMCSSTWANQEYSWWGIDSYPDLAALQGRTQAMEKAGWYNYISAFSLLGTSESGLNPVPFPNPIYNLFLIENNAAAIANYRGLAEDARKEVFTADDALMKETGGLYVLVARVWSDARYGYFGITAAPDLASHRRYIFECEDANHASQYTTTGFHLMGTEYQPG